MLKVNNFEVYLGCSVILNCISIVFFCTSMGAVSFHYDTLVAVNWVNVHNQGDHAYVGFRAVATKLEGFDQSFTKVFRITSCNTGTFADDNVCSKCGGSNGEACMVLLSIALILSVFSLFSTISRYFDSKNLIKKWCQLTLLFLCFVSGVSCFANYSDCHKELQESFPQEYVSFGPGYALCLVASFLLVIVFIIGCYPIKEIKDATPSNPASKESVPIPKDESEIIIERSLNGPADEETKEEII